MRYATLSLFAFALAIAILAPPSAARGGATPDPALVNLVKQADSATNVPKVPTTNDSRQTTTSASSAVANEADQSAIARYKEIEYRANQVKAVYDQQYWASWIVLALVVSIVVSALVFSVMQARISYGSTDAAIRVAVANNAKIALSPGKIEITSSVLGTITLAIAALFLWLYLTTVYPINPERPAAGSTDTSATSTNR
jgi:hypothetical protein